MERMFDKEKIAASIAKSKYCDLLETLDIDFYLIKYDKEKFGLSNTKI